MILRPMQLSDLDAVFQIEQQVQSHPWSKAQLADSCIHHQCTVLEQQQQVLGFCIMQPVLDEANLLLMAIAPDFQGQGLGFQLLQKAIASLGTQCTQIFLEVRESNVAAIHLYQKIGFHQIDLRKHYYPLAQGKREHAIIMVYMLDMDVFGFGQRP
jgi:ribosomal-protein-alanine N-acetyltransferase